MASQILTTAIIILVVATSTAQSLSREEADEYIRSFMSRTGSSSTTTDSTTDAPMTVVGGTVEVVEAVKVREMVEVRKVVKVEKVEEGEMTEEASVRTLPSVAETTTTTPNSIIPGAKTIAAQTVSTSATDASATTMTVVGGIVEVGEAVKVREMVEMGEVVEMEKVEEGEKAEEASVKTLLSAASITATTPNSIILGVKTIVTHTDAVISSSTTDAAATTMAAVGGTVEVEEAVEEKKTEEVEEAVEEKETEEMKEAVEEKETEEVSATAPPVVIVIATATRSPVVPGSKAIVANFGTVTPAITTMAAVEEVVETKDMAEVEEMGGEERAEIYAGPGGAAKEAERIVITSLILFLATSIAFALCNLGMVRMIVELRSERRIRRGGLESGTRGRNQGEGGEEEREGEEQ